MRTASLFLILFLGAAFSNAQSPLDRPRIGYFVDSGGGLRPLYGTAANFILGDVLSSGHATCASSNTATLIKTPEAVLLIGTDGDEKTRWAAPGGDAMFAFHAGGAAALVLFAEGPALSRVVEDRLEPIPLDRERLGGKVVAVAAPDRVSALLAVVRGEEIWQVTVATESGEVLDERLLPGVAGRVHLLGDGSLLYTDRGELVWRAADGVERRFALEAEVDAFTPLGASWVAITARHADAEGVTHYGLRLDAGREGLYQLPEVAQ
jgi:hypothetical protein